MSTPQETTKVIEAVGAIAKPLLDEQGVELVDIEYRKEKAGWILRLFIDKNEGINLDLCASISRELSDLLDVTDPITHPYSLEVSSPGLNRPLKKEEDFERFKGKKVRIKTIQPIGNRRNFIGILLGYKDGAVHVTIDHELLAIPYVDIKSANLEWAP